MTTTPQFNYTLGFNTEAGANTWTWAAEDGSGIEIVDAVDGPGYLYTVTQEVDGVMLEVSSFYADTLEHAKDQAEAEYLDAQGRL